MKEIRLNDGSLLEVKINFLTIKIIVDLKIDKIIRTAGKRINDQRFQFDIASKIIYAIIRSNGRKVDLDEAMILVPLDDEVITEIITEFVEKMNDFKKKQGKRKLQTHR